MKNDHKKAGETTDLQNNDDHIQRERAKVDELTAQILMLKGVKTESHKQSSSWTKAPSSAA